MKENKWEKIHLRTIQYWFEDGIVELGIGGLFLILGVYFYLQATQNNAFFAEILSGAFVLIFIGGWFLAGNFIRSAKERITFPRTGYVAYKPDKTNKKFIRLVLAMIAGALISGALLVLLSERPLGIDNLMPAATGLTIAIVLGVIGIYTGLLRFLLSAVFSLACGIGLTASGIDNTIGGAFVYLASALVLFVTGGLVFRQYLHNNPAPTEDMQ